MKIQFTHYLLATLGITLICIGLSSCAMTDEDRADLAAAFQQSAENWQAYIQQMQIQQAQQQAYAQQRQARNAQIWQQYRASQTQYRHICNMCNGTGQREQASPGPFGGTYMNTCQFCGGKGY